MTFNLKAIKGLMDEAHQVLGHPLAKLAFGVVLGALPKFGEVSDEDMAELKRHAAGYDDMLAEAKRRAGTALDS